jgi:hypothetical protein
VEPWGTHGCCSTGGTTRATAHVCLETGQAVLARILEHNLGLACRHSKGPGRITRGYSSLSDGCKHWKPQKREQRAVHPFA